MLDEVWFCRRVRRFRAVLVIVAIGITSEERSTCHRVRNGGCVDVALFERAQLDAAACHVQALEFQIEIRLALECKIDGRSVIKTESFCSSRALAASRDSFEFGDQVLRVLSSIACGKRESFAATGCLGW